MKLTDQEQVILKAIGSGVAEVSRVIKAVGYPKATVKKVLVRLSEKGIVTLHRHDWPSSLKPDQRKMMVRIGRDYFNAVSMRKRNPQSKGKTALKKTGRALKGFAKGALSAGAQILGAGATALNPSQKRKKKNKTVIKAKRVVVLNPKKKPAKKAGTKRRRNLDHKDSKHQVEVSRHWRAGGLSQWQRAHKAGQHDLFSHGIKARNPKDVIVKTREVVSAQGKRFKYYLRTVDTDTNSYGPLEWGHGSYTTRAEALKAGREALKQRRKNPKRVKKHASRTISAAKAAKRRAGASRKNSPKKASAKVRSVAKARKAPVKRASKNPTRKGMRRGYAKARRLSKKSGDTKTMRLAARYMKQRGIKHAPRPKRTRKNPDAVSIRKEFAGTVNGERDLFFPQGTPAGKLAKLGKLVSITTEEGTIKPVSGSAWLCADTRGKLHIGSTSGAPLFDGPKRSFGHVTKLEYESTKPHLGYKGPIIWFHRAGEENGIRPTLHADGKGGIVFRGGDYRLTRRGIEN
jgi:hypothetical protein